MADINIASLRATAEEARAARREAEASYARVVARMREVRRG